MENKQKTLRFFLKSHQETKQHTKKVENHTKNQKGHFNDRLNEVPKNASSKSPGSEREKKSLGLPRVTAERGALVPGRVTEKIKENQKRQRKSKQRPYHTPKMKKGNPGHTPKMNVSQQKLKTTKQFDL